MPINGLGGFQVFNPFMYGNRIAIKSFGKIYVEGSPALPTSRSIKSIPKPPGFGSCENTPGVFMTKTEATRSDDEILNEVVALAKQHAQKGRYGGNTKEYHALLGEFMSSVSPDRQAIFAQGVESTEKEIKSKMSKPVIDVTPFTLPLINKSSVTSSFFYDWHKRVFDIGTVQFYDEKGETIGSYSGNHGWGWSPTKAEVARRVELSNLYHNTFETEKNKVSNSTNAAGFDFAAHNVSNQQNQAAQTTTTQTTTAQKAISSYEQMQAVEHKK
jgi:hypothetical protein